MAITHKLDIHIQKKIVVVTNNTNDLKNQYFLAPSEKEAIIEKLYIYTEELAQLNLDGVPFMIILKFR